MANRTIVYVDGFNLYYGLLKDTPYRWLNLQLLVEKLLPDDNVWQIKFFTALAHGRPLQRQKPLLSALSTCQKVTTILGVFKRHYRKCKVKACQFPDKSYGDYEEKRTDVNIAIHMVGDAYRNAASRFVLVSGDTDLAPPLELIRREWPSRKTRVFLPSNHPERMHVSELRHAAHETAHIPKRLLPLCQFPDPVIDSNGEKISKPASW